MNALTEYEQYMPSALLWHGDAWLLLFWSGANFLIISGFLAISLAIWLVLRRRPDMAHRGPLRLFAAFIMLFGITHAVSIMTLWWSIQPLMVIMMLAAGTASIVCAVTVYRLIPEFIRVPPPRKHDEVISNLEVALAELSIARDGLQDTAEKNAEALNDATARLGQNAREDILRSRNLIQTVSMLTQPGVYLNDLPELFMRDLRGRVNALAAGTSAVMEHEIGTSTHIERVVRRLVEPLLSDPDAKLAVTGDTIEVGIQGAQQLSLIAWELARRFVQIDRWEREGARIAVAWTISHRDLYGEEVDPSCTFEWREILQPTPTGSDLLDREDRDLVAITPEPLSDFSDRLLTQIIPRLLNGKARIDIEASTFIYRLICPLSALQAAEVVGLESEAATEGARINPTGAKSDTDSGVEAEPESEAEPAKSSQVDQTISRIA